jgi:NAD(P)-dependent dehydrogenase (short-subunit alcohol dehydrogenase family)
MLSKIALAIAGTAVVLHFAVRASYPVFTKGVVVITGASTGIGEHAAAGIADAGYTVYAGVRSAKDGERLKAKYPKLKTWNIDVTNPESIRQAVAQIAQVVSPSNPLVALVNNAGVQKDLPVELQSSASDRYTFDVNVFGLIDVTRAFLPLLRRTGPGARIVNIGSLNGVLGAPGSATYVASKFAVEGFTDCLRMELDHFKISVSLLEPGYVKSEMGTKVHAESKQMYGVSKENFELYDHVFSGFYASDLVNGNLENSAPATVTTGAILHAIQSPHPKTRYVVAVVNGGLPAWVVARLKWLLPDRVMDKVVLTA